MVYMIGDFLLLCVYSVFYLTLITVTIRVIWWAIGDALNKAKD